MNLVNRKFPTINKIGTGSKDCIKLMICDGVGELDIILAKALFPKVSKTTVVTT